MTKVLLTIFWIVAALAVVTAWVTALEVLYVRAALQLWAVLIILVGIIGFFTARSGNWFLFILTNLAIMAFVFYYLSTARGDPAAPTNFALIFLVPYLPVHAAVTLVVGGAYWFIRRPRSSGSVE